MSLIQVTDLTFSYDGGIENIFEHVTLNIDTDWKLGFIGRNGRGKTTFLRLLTGKYEYTGNIAHSTSFAYFPFEVQNPSASTREVMESAAPDTPDWQLVRELNLLGLSEETLKRPFDTLSHGERTKVLLAGLFLKENRFLLIDEPTNHLDAEGRALLARYLNTKTGFILVSHDRVFLDRCVDHILSINKKDIEIQRGNFTSWQQNKDLQDAFEEAQNEKLQKEAARLKQAARRTAGWSDRVEASKYGGDVADRGYVGHKSAKMMRRAKSIQDRREKAVEEKSKLLRNIETAEPLSLSSLTYPKAALMEAKDLCLYYGERKIAGPLSFTLSRGERIALTGKNGCGKSTLLKLILGENILHTGLMRLGSGLVVSYIPQDASLLRGDLRECCRERGIEESYFKTILRKLDFRREQLDKKPEDLSPGQKKKVLLALSLCQRAHLYVWDEPLNYIDLLSRMQIEALILSCRPAMLFVEHDLAFVQNVATRVIEMAK